MAGKHYERPSLTASLPLTEVTANSRDPIPKSQPEIQHGSQAQVRYSPQIPQRQQESRRPQEPQGPARSTRRFKLGSAQVKSFFAGFDDLKAIQRAVNNAAKAQEGKCAAKLEKQIAKLQKQLDAVKGAK